MSKVSQTTYKPMRHLAATDDQVAQLTQRLREATGRLHEDRIWIDAIINSLGEGLIIVDEHGQITTANPYALRVFDCQNEDLVGKWFPGAVVAVDQYGQPMDPFQRPSIRALSSGQAVSDYIYYVTQDGTPVPVFVTASPIIIDDKPAGAVMVFRDLTEEKKLDIAKEEFISLASHQLRTPASGVKSVLAMLANGDFGDLSALQLKYINKALEANNRQLSIIEDMLHAAKIDAGKLEYEPRPTDVTKLLRDTMDDHKPLVEARGQTVHLHTSQQCWMMVDAPKLRMVMDNLINNASKYSKNGGVIEVALNLTAKRVALAVSDTGVGIPMGEVPKLFKKFSRLDNELSTLVGGSGLGLFLARNIIQLHGGTITVKSEVGSGSTFTVLLPRQEETTS